MELPSPVSILLVIVCVVLVAIGARRSLHKNVSEEVVRMTTTTIDSTMALLWPVIASFVLLALFYFFLSLSWLLVGIMAFSGFFSIVYALYPLCDEWLSKIRWIPSTIQVQSCDVGEMPGAVMWIGVPAALGIVAGWVLFDSWLAIDILGACFVITTIAHLRVKSLKIIGIVFIGLFVYDVLWVFISPALFGGSNVMVEVATKPASNPIASLAEIVGVSNTAKEIQLPNKLMIPALFDAKREFLMIGLGDLAIPGMLVSYLLRFDQQKEEKDVERVVTVPSSNYYRVGLVSYAIGLGLAIFVSSVFHAAQPALFYIVPSMLCAVGWSARHHGDFKALWKGIEREPR